MSNKTNIIGLQDTRAPKQNNTGTPQKNVKSSKVYRKVTKTKQTPKLNKVQQRKSYGQQLVDLAKGMI